jgi:broad specificity phosphatase PhoE
MHVYLIRHAQSAGNVMNMRSKLSAQDFNSLLLQSPDLPLTAVGEQQAQGVAARLAHIHPTRVYSSPFLRALKTAQAYCAVVGMEPQIVDELHEVIPDLLNDGRRTASLRRHYLRSFVEMAWARSGPTWRSEYRRAKLAWAIITAEPGDAIVAFSHAWMISMMLLALRRNPDWRVVSRDLDNVGISIVVRR